ncbi:MAG: DUF4129 domain-containing protein [Terrimesophilobacter sp.]
MRFAAVSGALGLALDSPLDPDREQAQQWMIDELSKPPYQAAKPTLWDLMSKAFWDWLNSLRVDGDNPIQLPIAMFVVIVVAAIVVAAFFIFGMPRINRRSAVIGSLFGADEERDAETLRRAASAAAANRDWTLAIEELFRALARVLAERVIVATDPGTTAHGFASRAGAVFPDYLQRLTASATAFDSVRYLDKPGTEAHYSALAELERELRTAQPAATAPTPLVGTR